MTVEIELGSAVASAIRFRVAASRAVAVPGLHEAMAAQCTVLLAGHRPGPDEHAGRRLRWARMSRCMSQPELALAASTYHGAAIGIGTICKAEAGTQALAHPDALALALGCSPGWLAFGEGDPWARAEREAAE